MKNSLKIKNSQYFGLQCLKNTHNCVVFFVIWFDYFFRLRINNDYLSIINKVLILSFYF
jgi:hypothetical protein